MHVGFCHLPVPSSDHRRTRRASSGKLGVMMLDKGEILMMRRTSSATPFLSRRKLQCVYERRTDSTNVPHSTAFTHYLPSERFGDTSRGKRCPNTLRGSIFPLSRVTAVRAASGTKHPACSCAGGLEGIPSSTSIKPHRHEWR